MSSASRRHGPCNLPVPAPTQPVDAAPSRPRNAPTQSPPQPVDATANRPNHIVARVQQTVWQGQMPHPEDIARYDEVYPGAAKIIFTTFSEQTKHRMTLEKAVVQSNIFMEKAGLACGFLFLMGALLLAAFAIAHGQAAASVLIACGAAASGVGAFVWGRSKQQHERQVKMEDARARLPQGR